MLVTNVQAPLHPTLKMSVPEAAQEDKERQILPERPILVNLSVAVASTCSAFTLSGTMVACTTHDICMFGHNNSDQLNVTRPGIIDVREPSQPQQHAAR